MTKGQYTLSYGDETWTIRRCGEYRITAAEIKIIIEVYINLVYKRHLDLMKELYNKSCN
jgi:hypothetical protein